MIYPDYETIILDHNILLRYFNIIVYLYYKLLPQNQIHNTEPWVQKWPRSKSLAVYRQDQQLKYHFIPALFHIKWLQNIIYQF